MLFTYTLSCTVYLCGLLGVVGSQVSNDQRQIKSISGRFRIQTLELAGGLAISVVHD